MSNNVKYKQVDELSSNRNDMNGLGVSCHTVKVLSLIHISEPTRPY